MTSRDYYHREVDLSAGDLICIENHRPMEITLLNDEDYQKLAVPFKKATEGAKDQRRTNSR